MTVSASLMLPVAPQAPAELLQLSALEVTLSQSDADAQATLASTREQIAQIRERVSRAMSGGAAPGEFSVLQAIAQACDAAQQILDTTVAAGPTQGSRRII